MYGNSDLDYLKLSTQHESQKKKKMKEKKV